MADGGVLTWRNVDAPNFGSTLDAIKASGQALSSALTGASDGLGKFDQTRKSDAEDAVVRAAQGYATPDALHQAISDGSIYDGIDKSLIGTHAVNAVNQVGANLLNQALGNQTYKQNDVLNPIAADQARNTLALGQSKLAVAQGTQDAEIKAGNLDPALKQSTINSNNAGTRNTTANAILTEGTTKPKIASAQTEADQSAYNLGFTKSSAAGQAAALDVARLPDQDARDSARAQATAGLDVPGQIAYDSYLATHPVGQNAAGVLDASIRGAGQSAPGAVSATAPNLLTIPTSLTTGGSALDPFDTIKGSLPPETQAYPDKVLAKAGTLPVYSPTAVNGKSNAQAIAQQIVGTSQALPSVESGGRSLDANGNVLTSGAGAEGKFQLMPKTQGAPGYGVAPLPNNPTLADQQKFSTDYLAAMIDKTGSVKAGLAAYNAGPGTVGDLIDKAGNYTPDKILARNRAEVGGAVNLNQSVDQMINNSGNTGIQNQFGNLRRKIATPEEMKQGLPAPDAQGVGDVVKALGGPDGNFADVPRGTLGPVIQDLVTKANVKPAVAGALLQRYGYENVHGWLVKGLGQLAGGTFGQNNAAYNDSSGLDAEIARIGRGDADKLLDTNSKAVTGAGMVNTALNTAQQADADLLTVQRRAANDTSLAKLLPGYRAKAEAAHASYDQVYKQYTEKDPDNAGKRRPAVGYRPVVTPPTPIMLANPALVVPGSPGAPAVAPNGGSVLNTALLPPPPVSQYDQLYGRD